MTWGRAAPSHFPGGAPPINFPRSSNHSPPRIRGDAVVPLTQLWLPVLLSAVVVFVASSVIHMVLRWHATDYAPVPEEEALMADLRRAGLEPGDYVVPHAATMEAMKDPAYQERVKRGRVAFITVGRNDPGMGRSLALWFVYTLVVGIFAGYVAGRALGPGADYLAVFRFAGVTALAGYSLAIAQNSIWYGRSWSSSLKTMADGLIYALLTAGVFGWLWPG